MLFFFFFGQNLVFISSQFTEAGVHLFAAKVKSIRRYFQEFGVGFF